MTRKSEVIIDGESYDMFVHLNGQTSLLPTKVVEKESQYYEGIGNILMIADTIFRFNNCVWREFDIESLYNDFKNKAHLYYYEDEELEILNS